MKSTSDLFKVIRLFLVVNIIGNVVLNIRNSGVLFYANLVFLIITLQMQYDRKEIRTKKIHGLFVVLDVAIIVLAILYLFALAKSGVPK
jgi:hypothetical protein